MSEEKVALRTAGPLEGRVRVSTEDTVVFEIPLSSLEDVPVELSDGTGRGTIAWVNVNDAGDRLMVGVRLETPERDRKDTLLYPTEPPPPPPEEEAFERKHARIPTEGIVILTPPSSPVGGGTRRTRSSAARRERILFMIGFVLAVAIFLPAFLYAMGRLVDRNGTAGPDIPDQVRPDQPAHEGRAEAPATEEGAAVATVDGTGAPRLRPAHSTDRTEKKAPSATVTPSAVARTKEARGGVVVRRHGRRVEVEVPLDGMPQGFSHYPLRDPPGVVVNVKGAVRPLRMAPGVRGVRKLRVLRLTHGSRLIVYTERRVSNVRIRTSSTALHLSFDL